MMSRSRLNLLLGLKGGLLQRSSSSSSNTNMNKNCYISNSIHKLNSSRTLSFPSSLSLPHPSYCPLCLHLETHSLTKL
jgi:hypothetical protein